MSTIATINGTDAADTITFTDTSTTVNAGEGANTITATLGNNEITSGDGADTITVTSGNNTINAGGGANTITATSGVNVINTGDGADTITTGGVAGGGNTINAGDGANTITTGAGDDTVTGGNGVDTVTTGAGNDVVYGGNGANTITTGAGNDIVYTGIDIDTITTGAGDDTIHISGGTDTITAGADNDTLIADLSSATGAVSINALAGNVAAGYAGNISGLGIATFAGVENFEITSGDSDDTITTGDGTDIIRSGAGSDTVNLADGNDEAIYTMAANDGATDVYQGGAGVDTLTLEFTEDEWLSAGVQADIANYIAFQAANTGGVNSAAFQFTAFDLSVSDFEALNVVVDGVALPVAESDTAQLLPGGSVTLDVLANDSDVAGDHLTISAVTPAGQGTVTIEGNQLVYIADADASPGVDVVRYTIADPFGATASATAAFVIGSAQYASVTVGSDRSEVLTASDSADVVLGGLGDDTIQAEGGDDLIIWAAGDGNDVIDGGAGFDRLELDLPEDSSDGIHVYADAYGNVIVSGGTFSLTIDGVEDLSFVGGEGGANITFGDLSTTDLANETIYYRSANGSNADDYLNGRNANKTLQFNGGYGNDVLFGGLFNDVLRGDSGNDVIFGEDGNDLIEGGSDDDRLFGGGGDDEAIYNMAANTGASDVYQGGAGVDTLTLEFTEEEWNNIPLIQTEIVRYQDHLVNDSSDPFLFASGLKVSDFEHLSVRIGDGDATDMTLAPVEGMIIDLTLNFGVGEIFWNGTSAAAGGNGDDEINLGDYAGALFEYVTAEGGAGDDVITFGDYAGNYVGSASADGGVGDDTLSFGDRAGSEEGSVTAIGGDGKDTITFGTFAGDFDGSVSADGGAGDDTITFGDYAGNYGGSVSADGGAGDDEITFGKNAGESGSVTADGGAGVDTLTLEFTQEQWDSAEVKADVAAYLAFQEANTGGANSAAFQFTAFDLSASEFEALNVIVDGVATDPSDTTVLPATFGFVLNGIDQYDQSGMSVSTAGDVNGDGIDDIMIGAYGANPDGAPYTGETYVVFGKDTAFDAAIDLAGLDGSNGFVLNGIDQYDSSGISVSSAGDVNGDGIDDILIGAYGAGPDGAPYTGETYVVFGKDTGFDAAIDLSDLDGSNGFVLNGIDQRDSSGISVSSAGDVNGDGIDDIMIGAPRADPDGARDAGETYDTGETYVVFGKDTAFDAAIDLSDLDGSNGFVLNGIDQYDSSGISVSSAGDVNGDGIDDIMIGAFAGDPDGARDAGETYVVFGKDTAFDAAIDLADLDGSNGFVLNGIDQYDQSGMSVSSAGDVNGDGIDDILIGAYGAGPDGAQYTGETYVVFGKDTAFDAAIDLSDLDGSDGFVLNGIDQYDHSGRSVSSAGDVNGDGIDDILIGALYAGPDVAQYPGETYVVFGKDTVVSGDFDAAIDLSDLDGSDGFVFNGINQSDYSGRSVSSAGDVNGDGIDDIMIGAFGADPDSARDAGETYVVFGGADLLAAYDAADGVADGSIELSLIGEDPLTFI
jgi:Ca2+-binding RTX toxin-like protein